MKYLIILTLIILFNIDLFIISKKEDILTSCAFWAVIILFNIWYEIIKYDSKKDK